MPWPVQFTYAITTPHRDQSDYLQGLAGAFSVGDYKSTTLNFHEAGVSLELPAGALAFFPLHVVHHYNTPIAEGETRGSLTMFMSSDMPLIAVFWQLEAHHFVKATVQCGLNHLPSLMACYGGTDIPLILYCHLVHCHLFEVDGKAGPEG